MQNVTINQIDSILYDTMQRLLNGSDNKDCPYIEVDKAKAIQSLAKTAIESKKLQFHVVKAIENGDISNNNNIIQKTLS